MAEIVSTEDTLHGKPRIKGTRVSVKAVWEMHSDRGMSPVEIAEQLPTVSKADVRSALDYMKEDQKSSAVASHSR